MTIKEFIISRVQIFFTLVTLILTATVILGAIYQPCCVLPTCVTYFKKEPTAGQYIIRQIIELALIEAVVMLIISAPEGIAKPMFYLVLGTIIAVIYVLTMVMMWLQKVQQSKKLTEQLKNFQNNIVK